MRLLFVNPCLRRDAQNRFLPVGLGYVVTAVKLAGFEFDLLDLDLLQLDDASVESYVRTHPYDVIALGCIVTHYKWVKWFTQTIRTHQPRCTIVVGNTVGSSIPQLLLEKTPTDVVVLGEGDVTIVELLDALNRGVSLAPVETAGLAASDSSELHPKGSPDGRIRGIAFRDADGHVVNNGPRRAIRNIDDFPFPDWDIFDVARYIELGRRSAQETSFFPVDQSVVMPVNTARGCVYRCTFCHHVFWNDPYRHRSVASILGEIRQNVTKYGANYVNFWDELSFSSLRQAESVADALIEANLGIHWTAAIRSDLFGNPELSLDRRKAVAEKMVRSGALVVGCSLESANDEILAAMNKRVEAAYFAEQIRLLDEVGLRTNTSLVIGYPQETLETIRETMSFCLDHSIYPSAGFLMPMPGTGMWDYAVEHGYILDQDAYLTGLTERQDLNVNLTQIPSNVLLAEVKCWLQQINERLNLKLDSDRLIRTGGENKHTRSLKGAKRDATDSRSRAKISGSL